MARLATRATAGEYSPRRRRTTIFFTRILFVVWETEIPIAAAVALCGLLTPDH